MKLDTRLRAILPYIHGESMADVGCDHGKLCCYCLQHGLVKRAIATDISKPSLDKAQSLALQCGLSLTCIHTDGVRDMPEHVDTAVIAGMGAHEIVHILQQGAHKADRWVLVPHQHPTVLRRYLAESGWRPIADFVVRCAGKFYWILCVERGTYTPDAHALYLGACDPNEPDYREYLRMTLDKCRNLLAKTRDDAIASELQQQCAVCERALGVSHDDRTDS